MTSKNVFSWLSWVISALVIPVSLHAQTAYVTLTTTDNSPFSSFTNSSHWSDSQYPHSGTNYMVSNWLTLRTPENAGNYTFAGDSLTLSNAYVNLKGNGQITVDDLRAYSCRIANGINGSTWLYGTNTVFGTTSGPTRFSGSNNRYTRVYSVLQGSGEIQIERTSGENDYNFYCRFYADNSDFTGGITVTGWGINFAIADATGLGGELPAFRADALTIKNSGVFQNLGDLTLDSPTRGITVSNGATLDAANGNLTIETPIAGSGTLSIDGSGYTTTLNAPLTLDGDIDVIEQGVLAAGPDFSLPASHKIVLSSGTLTGTQALTNDVSVEGGVINPGSIGGTDTLTVSNVYYASGAFEFDFAQGVTSDLLRVTGDLTRAPGALFTIRLTQPVTNETGRFTLMTAANMGDYTADDFTLVASYYHLPDGYLEIADEGNGPTLFFVQARPVVELTASGNNAGDSFTSGARWSDGLAPNDGADYIVAHGYRLRTDGSTTATVAFGGHSLTLADGSDMRCKGLRAYIEDLRLFNQRITQGTPPNTQYLDGNLTVLGNFDFENDGSLSRVLVIESQMGGTNDIRFKMSLENPLSTYNGKFELTAANTNFTGAITVLGPNVTYLNITNETNLGGNPPAFRADQLTLSYTSVLQVVTSVTLDDANRGITLGGTGGILDAASNATFSVACPITGNRLYKRGTGFLVLSGANSHTNGTVVEDGTLELRSENALGTGPLAVAAGTYVRVPLDETNLPLGVRLGGTTPLTVADKLLVDPDFGEDPLPKAFNLPLFLLTGTTAFDTAVVSPQNSPFGYRVTVETQTVDDGGTSRTQVYIHYVRTGTLIMVQ